MKVNFMTRNFSIGQMIAALLCASILSLAACSDDDNPDAPNPEEIETELTDPAQVIEAHEKALSKKNYAAYEALLDDTFEFFPSQQDAQDFPWMTGTSWPLSEELEIISHMFDPNFGGQENPVSAIEVAITVLSQRALTNGGTELTCTIQGEVLTAENNGWSFDTRIIFELVPRDGFLRIAKAREIDAFRAATSVESNSWGVIKALYR